MITALIKNELNETVSRSTFADWDELIQLFSKLHPSKRPSLSWHQADGEKESTPKKLTIVILEGEDISWDADEVEITVRSSHEEEY